VFSAASNKKEIADKQKMGRASEDPNLPIDDRKLTLPYKQ